MNLLLRVLVAVASVAKIRKCLGYVMCIFTLLEAVNSAMTLIPTFCFLHCSCSFVVISLNYLFIINMQQMNEMYSAL